MQGRRVVYRNISCDDCIALWVSSGVFLAWGLQSLGSRPTGPSKGLAVAIDVGKVLPCLLVGGGPQTFVVLYLPAAGVHALRPPLILR